MTYIPGSGSGGGSVAASSDVALNNVANNEVLTFDSSVGKWKNAAAPAGGGTVETIPPGSTLTVQKVNGAWPARPTGRSDVTVQWKGPDPSPAIVTSGTGGMLNNIDIRLITP